MTAIHGQQLWSGFSDPVLQSQSAFRALLTALSEPGKIVRLTAPDPTGELCPAAWATVLTLADCDSPVWVSPGLNQSGLADNLRFHCGTPVTSETAKAAFVLLLADEWGSLDVFATGDDFDPHRSATLIVQVSGLNNGTRYRLSGPGIETERQVRVSGLSPLHQRLLAENRQRFPGGVDVLLVSGNHLLGLPRTTEIKPVEEVN